MELGHGPKELVFQMFYCTVCLCYIQSFGKPSKPNRHKIIHGNYSCKVPVTAKSVLMGKTKLKIQERGEKHGTAYAGREMSKK